MHKDGRWTPDEIAASIDGTVGVEKMPIFDILEQMAKRRAEKEAAE